MTIYRDIQSDLRNTLMGVPGLPDVAWQGRRYEIRQGVPYIREMLRPETAPPVTLGFDGYTRETFTYILTIFWPPDNPLFDLYDLADAIRVRYNVGARVGSQDVHGRITYAVSRALMVEKDWWSLPVRVTGFVHRPTLSIP